MKKKAPFEMELGGDTYRVALDMNAIVCIRRETGHSHEPLLARLSDPDTDMFDRIDALRVLVWAMLATDCGTRKKIPQPSIEQVGLWLQDDGGSIAEQLQKFFGVKDEAQPEGSLAPFVPTPPAVVKKMIALAELQPNEHVVDLGAGDGRVLFAAVDAADVTASGYETHAGRCEALRKAMSEHAKSDRLSVFAEDIREAYIKGADVVFMYLLPSSNEHLKPKLLKELKPGARVVSHDFDMPGWEAEQVETLKAEGRNHTVYQWRIPERLSPEERGAKAAAGYIHSLAE